ncbi:MAG TPA: nucleotidyltransferase family protein [Burkholderiaceae bacterium]|nr:nucleotidyltransferase family protein [Burkholderiaceae bacterium]
MRAMILAAGRGERMRPLTDTCPKPLLPVGGRPLIEWHLLRLARAGIREVVINHAHLGHLIEAALGDGARWSLKIRYSPEAQALETAGGIAQALPLLGHEPFLVVNGDVFTDFDFGRAPGIALQMQAARLDAWCVMVPNPAQHPHGDFTVRAGRLLRAQPNDTCTFSGVALYQPSVFAGIAPGTRLALRPILDALIDASRAGAECHDGQWVDVGTVERLAQLDAQCRLNAAPPHGAQAQLSGAG